MDAPYVPKVPAAVINLGNLDTSVMPTLLMLLELYHRGEYVENHYRLEAQVSNSKKIFNLLRPLTFLF